MIKQILTLILTALLTGGGSWFLKGCENDKVVQQLEKKIQNKADTLGLKNDTLKVLKFKVIQLQEADSSNKFFIKEKEKVLLEQRGIISKQSNELFSLRKWKADAEDDGIITPDTVKIKKRFLRKGYKVIK